MDRTEKNRYGTCIRKKICRNVITLLVCLLAAFPVLADGAEQQERWLYLLLDNEVNSDGGIDCEFFARPSSTGYETGEDTRIYLTMDIPGRNKSYELELCPVEGNDGWYASGPLEVSVILLKENYEVALEMTNGGDTSEKAYFEKADIQAEWPKLTDGTLELVRDAEGRVMYGEYRKDDWADGEAGSLLTYSIDNNQDCEVTLEKGTGKIQISNAANGGSFELAVRDPSGNRRVAKVNIVVAAQKGGLGMAFVAVIIIAVIVIAALVWKKIRGGDPPEEAGAAKEDVDKVRTEINTLLRRVDSAAKDVRETGRAVIAKISSGNTAGGYSVEEVKEMMDSSEHLEQHPGYKTLKNQSEILQTISGELLKMQGNKRITVKKGISDIENPKKYLDSEWRKNQLKKISNDEQSVQSLLKEISGSLQILRENIGDEDIPFQRDIDITVTCDNGQGARSYTSIYMARDEYGMYQPGSFSLDSLLLLAVGSNKWMTLQDILGYKSTIRVFSTESGIRVVASKPVMTVGENTVQRLEFAITDKPEIVLDKAVISLRFV